MKSSDEYSERRALDALYASEMAAALPKAPVRPKSTVQAASTQRVLDMTADELAKYRNRSVPDNWKANPNAKTLDEAVGARNFEAKQIVVVEGLRRGEKNTLGDFRSSNLSSASLERKERASDAFMYSPPAELSAREKLKVQELKTLESVDSRIEKKKTLLEKAREKLASLFTREKHVCVIGLGNTCIHCGEVKK